MNILVTGGGGFSGGYVSAYLTNLGYEVTATYRGTKPAAVLGKGKINYVKQELSERIDLSGQFDAIVHTACSHPGRMLCMTEYVRDNIDTARQIVDFARRSGIKTIIYFSTRSVYGDIRTKEVNEETDIINPDKYGVTKYIAEQIFQEANDLQTVGMRLPGIIGPGAHDIWLVNMVGRIQRGEDVEISDFDTKNLVSIDDISKFINKLVVSAANGEKFKYNIVNLSCRETINNLEIVELIKKKLGSDSEIKIRKRAPGLFWLDSEKACEMGFEPSTPERIVSDYLDHVCNIQQK